MPQILHPNNWAGSHLQGRRLNVTLLSDEFLCYIKDTTQLCISGQHSDLQKGLFYEHNKSLYAEANSSGFTELYSIYNRIPWSALSCTALHTPDVKRKITCSDVQQPFGQCADGCLAVGWSSCINSPHPRYLFITHTCGNRFQSNSQILHKIKPYNWQYMRVQVVRIAQFSLNSHSSSCKTCAFLSFQKWCSKIL